MFRAIACSVSLPQILGFAFDDSAVDRGPAGQAGGRSTRSGRSRGSRSCRSTTRTRSAGWPGDQSAKTTGHVIPVDGGLPEAFLSLTPTSRERV